MAAVPHTSALIDGHWVDSYEVWAEAVDNAGGITTSDSAWITVVDRVTRSVAVTMPQEPPFGLATFAPPATIVLSAAVDQHVGAGTIAKVEFVADVTPIGTAARDASTGEYMLTWRNVAAGARNIVARVTEADGSTVDSPPVAVVVRTPTGRPSWR